MKKLLSLVMLFVLVFTLSGCNNDEVLSVYFVPSRDAAEIYEATEPLKEMLRQELIALGFEYDEIEIVVGSSYEAVGEAMISGTADVGFLPGGTYALYSVDDEIDVALTALRSGLDKDSGVADDWNDGLATERVDGMVAYYRGLIVAGPSTYGQELAAKVEAGTALTWDDFDGANWCVRSSTSSSGFIYPTLWLMDQFDGNGIAELDSYVSTDGYGTSMASLAAGTCDLATIYADARMDYATKWVTATDDADAPGFGRDLTIWEETAVIGVTDGIYNDTISVSNITVDADLKAAIQTAFINIAATEAGQDVIAIYSHAGYQLAVSADYDNERAAQAILQGE